MKKTNVGVFDFPYSWIFLPPICLLFFCFCFFAVRESWWGHCPWISFSQIYFTFFMIYAFRLRFYEPFFNVIFCVCSLLFFFSQPDVNITWITGHVHRSIVDKIDLTSEFVEMVKKIPDQLHWLHIFVKCDQKNLFSVPSIDQ